MKAVNVSDDLSRIIRSLDENTASDLDLSHMASAESFHLFSVDEMNCLIDALHRNTSVVTLSLANQTILGLNTDDGLDSFFDRLLDSMHNKRGLSKLNMESCSIASIDVKRLFKLLKQVAPQQQLRINLQQNQIYADDFIMLLNKCSKADIPAFSSLEINLMSNPISQRRETQTALSTKKMAEVTSMMKKLPGNVTLLHSNNQLKRSLELSNVLPQKAPSII
ncbi:MAG: hypothetical protein IPP74_01875 [Alphaproteobacteria bacterium]|nr:hypothetical protein [Alphaproteobacteria bacterium]